MDFVILMVTSLAVGVTHAQFLPGCSFTDGRCMYNVQLGHQGQCDAVRAVTSGNGDCCDALQGQVTTLTADVSLLKTQLNMTNMQVDTLMSELLGTKHNLSSTTDQLTEAERQTQHLLQTLAEKEAALNATQADLTRVLSQAGDEIRNLRETVSRQAIELNTCKGTLGLATNTSTFNPGSSVLPDDVTLTFCDFETFLGRDATCGYTNQSYGFDRGSGQISDRTGPIEDHTLGSPHGHYMFMNATRMAESFWNRGVLRSTGMVSPLFQPGPGYCIRFWYNMYGSDTKDFRVYAQVAGGNGYPIFSHTGQLDQTWKMAEVSLDREYTSYPFHLVFEATTTTFTYNGYSYTAINDMNGDIAVDDIYVYNTSCSNVPLCPAGGVRKVAGNSTTCYTFHTEPRSWYEAASKCREQGATSYLVTVTSQQEQDFLVQTIRGDVALSAAGQYGYYTGGTDERTEHTFDWTDTGVPYQGQYTNWKVGQPNDVGGSQDCLLLQYPELGYQWGDVDCSEKHPFICKTIFPTAASVGSGSASPLLG